MAKSWNWLTRTQVADVLGCGPLNFDQRVRPKMARSAIRGSRATLRFDVREAVRVWVENQIEINGGGDDDDIASAMKGDTTAAERWRNEQYIAAKRKNDEYAKVIVNREAVVQAMSSGINAFRLTVLQLEATPTITGKEARIICDEGINAFELAANKALHLDTHPIESKPVDDVPERARPRGRNRQPAPPASPEDDSGIRGAGDHHPDGAV